MNQCRHCALCSCGQSGELVSHRIDRAAEEIHVFLLKCPKCGLRRGAASYAGHHESVLEDMEEILSVEARNESSL